MDIQAYIQSGIVESYVLGLANAEEIAEIEQLRLEYPEVNQAILDFELSLEKQAMDNAVSPLPGVREKLFDTLSSEFETEAPVVPINEEITATPVIPIQQQTSRSWKWVAAAAIILLAGSIWMNIYYYGRYQKTASDYQALVTERNSLQANTDLYQTKLREMDSSLLLMQSPVMAVIKMPGVPGKEGNTATVYWNTQTKDVYLLAAKLPTPETGKQYQLWAIVDGKPVDAGMMGNCNGLCKMKNIPRAQAFAITLEKEGGSPSPTLSALYVMGKI